MHCNLVLVLLDIKRDQWGYICQCLSQDCVFCVFIPNYCAPQVFDMPLAARLRAIHAEHILPSRWMVEETLPRYMQYHEKRRHERAGIVFRVEVGLC